MLDILVFKIFYRYNRNDFSFYSSDISMEDKNFWEQVKKRNEELSTINEIGRALTSTLDAKVILSIIMQQISFLLQPKNWSLLLVDDDKDDLYFEIVVGEYAEKIKDIRLKMGEGIAGWVAQNGKPLLLSNVYDDPRFSPKADLLSNFRTKSIVCVPVISRDRTIGVLELINYCDDKEFTEDDMRILSILADYTAIALENARYYDMAKRLILTDELTGLYNSRYLHQLLNGEGDEELKDINQVSMIFIDLDYFKNINDKFGHLVGSKTLRELGSLLQNVLAGRGKGIRYGGDEFVIILPKTDKAKTYEIARQIRSKIKSTRFLTAEGLNIKLTASFGIASIPEDASNYQELIGEADKAMYQVKNTFRDGISLAKTTWASDY
jgi:diguanylate cyclase (GGDEF)-like protein